MKNKVTLRGVIRDITYSHNIKDIEYNKANIIVSREDDKADILTLKFKSLSNPYTNNQTVELTGNLRSYTTHTNDNKSKVQLYVFTYFDRPDNDTLKTNVVELEGIVCSIDEIRQSSTGKHSVRFILANNLKGDSVYKFDSYIPCVIYGKEAINFYKSVSVKDKLMCTGEFHSREYKKYLDDDMEIRVAMEVSVNKYEVC